MAQSEAFRSKLGQLLEPLGSAVYALAEEAGGAWDEVCLDVRGADVSHVEKICLIRRGSQDAIPSSPQVRAIIRQVWQLRQTLVANEVFYGLKLSITEGGKFSMQLDYNRECINDPDFNSRIQSTLSANVSVEHRNLIERSMAELRAKTEAHDRAWRMSQIARWGVDQDSGTITFVLPDGLKVTCSAQIIGTYNGDDGTWLWGWDHPSVNEPLRKHAKLVHAYGQTNQIAGLTTRKLDCSESDAWQFTALACHLAQAQGAYRSPSGSAQVFITFDNVTLSKPGAQRR